MEQPDRGRGRDAAADDAQTYADTIEDQAEFEQLLREHDGDFQAAVDAHKRGERPKDPPEAPSRA